MIKWHSSFPLQRRLLINYRRGSDIMLGKTRPQYSAIPPIKSALKSVIPSIWRGLDFVNFCAFNEILPPSPQRAVMDFNGNLLTHCGKTFLRDLTFIIGGGTGLKFSKSRFFSLHPPLVLKAFRIPPLWSLIFFVDPPFFDPPFSDGLLDSFVLLLDLFFVFITCCLC